MHAALGGAAPEGARDGNHPVEVRVDEDALRRPGQLARSLVLPAELVLRGNRMTCATCHDARSPEPSRTALPMRGSTMCFACHRV
ncbi:MAG TPA: cytochrome c3 family protein [Gemmatimonadaceae bacterium]|nr:cytochrome c3 family protein [Gemmatimonadaceae bacterium]